MKKIAIIGAGIVGLYIAIKLKEKGEEVIVFEKEKEVGNKPCSGLISKRIEDFIEIDKNIIKGEFNKIRAHFKNKDVLIKLSPPLYLFNKKELNEFFLKRAQERGVDIHLNSPIKSLPKSFDYIIGCDGALSDIRRILKLDKPVFRLGLQYFVSGVSEEIEVWPLIFQENPKYGFLWKIPGKTFVEYGAVGHPKFLRKEFLKFLNREQITYREEKIKAALIPQGLILPSLSNITLCGDAAGLTKPTSGGGVIWGLKAANILVDTFPNFSLYRRKVKKFFLPKIFKGKLGIYLAYHFYNFLPKSVRIDSDLF